MVLVHGIVIAAIICDVARWTIKKTCLESFHLTAVNSSGFEPMRCRAALLLKQAEL